MKSRLLLSVLFSGCILLPSTSAAQQTAATLRSAASNAVPSMINYSGVLKDSTGRTLTSVTGVTFLLYSSEQGGAPLWLETQNVEPDKSGHYTVRLGSASKNGISPDLFVNGEARWLAVQVVNESEQPRTLLVAVPYAMKAVDAETLGGFPASAFVPAANAHSGSSASGVRTASAGNAPPPGTITGITAGIDLTGGGTSGNVTLNVDTTKVPRLATANTFTASQAVTGTITANTSSTTANGVVGNVTAATGTTAGVLGTTTSSSGYAVEGLALSTTGKPIGVYGLSSSPTGYGVEGTSGNIAVFGNAGASTSGIGVEGTSANVGVFGQGNVAGVKGHATATGGLSGLFTGGPVSVAGNHNNGLIGDPGCGAGYAGMGFTTGSLSGCTNYALLGGNKGDTFVNSSGTAKIHFRSNNNELVTIDNSGNVNVIGQNGGGNLKVKGTLTVDGTQSFLNVLNVSNSNSSGALQVTNLALSGPAPAIVGTTFSPQANGVKGIVGVTGSKEAGLYGLTQSTANGYGVEGNLGNLSGVGVGIAGSIGGAGVWGDAGAGTSGNAGVQGSADNGAGGLFINNSNTNPALVVGNSGGGGGCTGCAPIPAGLVLLTEGGTNGSGRCVVDVNGNVSCTGKLGADAAVNGGKRQVALYSTQATENWFEDAGSGQLVNGSATVAFDPTFAQTVNTGVEYHVFLTPIGECKGLYVAHKTATSFEVHEMGGGTSSIAFDYRIMAKRVGYEKDRLLDVTAKYQQLEIQRTKRMQRMGGHNAATEAAVVRPTAAAQK